MEYAILNEDYLLMIIREWANSQYKETFNVVYFKIEDNGSINAIIQGYEQLPTGKI